METTNMPIPHAPATTISFTTTGQLYHQTTSFAYLEIDHRIRAGWMSFNRNWAELYDRATALLDLKTRMVKSEVVEALLYGCAAWTPLKGDYQKLRAVHHRMLLRIFDA